MTHTADPSDTDIQPSLLALALLYLFQFLQNFAGQHARLKAIRNRKPPANWQSHWEGLAQCEHNIARILRAGVGELLAGRELDLLALRASDEIDPAFATQPPRTCAQMHRRFEAIARFHANPERYIRRQAARIMRELNRDPFAACPLRLASQSTSPALRAVEETHRRLSSSSAQHWRGQRVALTIATSSSRDGGGSLRTRGPP